MKLYVGNLSFSTTEGDLSALFSQVGEVKSLRLMTDRETGQSRGFAFVELSSRSEGESAISQFNGLLHNGRELKVNEAKPQEASGTSNRGGGRGGFSSRGGGGYSRY